MSSPERRTPVAAVAQPVSTIRRSRLPALVTAALVTLVLPTHAWAHATAPVNALDYEARITSVGGAALGIRARVIDGDRKLDLRVPEPHTVVVLGDAGEPFLRFSPHGVDVNDRSPTAIINKLARRGSLPALDPYAAPMWRSVARRPTFRWHDHRLGPTPGRSYGEGAVDRWSIPVVVDGRPDGIVGRLWHARRPPLWPWLCALAASIGLAVLVAVWKGARWLSLAAVVAAALACAARGVLGVGLSFAPGSAALSAWLSVVVACLPIVVLAGLAVVRRGVYVLGAAALAATYAALVGLDNTSVLLHGYVISSLPATVTRVAAATAVCAGIVGATAAVRTLLDRDVLGLRSLPRLSPSPLTMTIPRGRASRR
jgi:hypothetical protein